MPQAVKNSTSASRRSALRLSVTAIAAGILPLTMAAAKSTPNTDAKLIRFCTDLTKVGSARRALCAVRGLTIEQEEAQMPEIRHLLEREDRLVEAITDTRPPRSLAGVSALAKVIMAISEIETGGNLCFEHENTETLTTLLTRVLAECEVMA